MNTNGATANIEVFVLLFVHNNYPKLRFKISRRLIKLIFQLSMQKLQKQSIRMAEHDIDFMVVQNYDNRKFKQIKWKKLCPWR